MERRQFLKLTPAIPATAGLTATLLVEQQDQPQVAGQNPVSLDVGVLRLQPGDVVVLSSQLYLSMETRLNIKQLVGSIFPDHRVLLLDGGLELGVLRGEAKA